MRKNPYYSIYYINLCRLIVLGVIPFVLLTFYNCAIYKRIRQGPKLIEENDLSKKVRRNQEHDLAMVLFSIVVLCILCHTLRFFLNFYEMIWINDILACTYEGKDGFPRWSYIVQEFSRLLLVFNSSVNIVIYCCFNQKFRRQVLQYKKTVDRKLTLRPMKKGETIDEESHHESISEMKPLNDKK